jgi:hypothetical protein
VKVALRRLVRRHLRVRAEVEHANVKLHDLLTSAASGMMTEHLFKMFCGDCVFITSNYCSAAQ